MGKTSVASRLNLPGRVAWMTMEAPGFLTLLYLMSTMPERHGIDDLPWQNRVLGGLFVSLFPPSSLPHTFHLSPLSVNPSPLLFPRPRLVPPPPVPQMPRCNTPPNPPTPLV